MPIDGTHFSSWTNKRRVLFDAPPANPRDGEFYYDNLNNRLAVFNARLNQWFFGNYTTTTSTSTSTTSTSTSTTSTSSSTSSSSSTSTSTSTSTTTTL